ncbi:MAG: hypothetical protein J0G99_03550 [Alphaproteobacteria bacterium]|nr:hypothetical protein [Alphaproteobacteria bacterium]
MSISAIASHTTVSHMQPAKASEAAEGPGPDHDGDSDDKGTSAVSAASTVASTPPGLGIAVNTSA